MANKTVITSVVTLTEKNFTVTKTGKKNFRVPVMDGVWVTAWINEKQDEKMNFKVGDTVMVVADKINSEDNTYNGETRKQHTFNFPNISRLIDGAGNADQKQAAAKEDLFGGQPTQVMEVTEEDLPF